MPENAGSAGIFTANPCPFGTPWCVQHLTGTLLGEVNEECRGKIVPVPSTTHNDNVEVWQVDQEPGVVDVAGNLYLPEQALVLALAVTEAALMLIKNPARLPAWGPTQAAE